MSTLRAYWWGYFPGGLRVALWGLLHPRQAARAEAEAREIVADAIEKVRGPSFRVDKLRAGDWPR